MPNIAELVECIGRVQYISTLDMFKGYWQISMASHDRAKNSIQNPLGLYKCVQVPFSLHGAMATFQRVMDRMLAPCAKYVMVYITNVVIFTKTWDQYLWAVKAILGKLWELGMMANPRKCTLVKCETKHMGFQVGHRIIKPLVDKI